MLQLTVADIKRYYGNIDDPKILIGRRELKWATQYIQSNLPINSNFSTLGVYPNYLLNGPKHEQINIKRWIFRL